MSQEFTQYYISYAIFEPQIRPQVSPGHSFIILSGKLENGSVKIIKEFGSYPPKGAGRLNVLRDDLTRFITSSEPHKAILNENEQGASRAYYGINTVEHRTWRISQAEYQKTLEIIERDKANIAKSFNILGMDGGRNCKKYTLDVLEEIGVEDARNEVRSSRLFLIETPSFSKKKLYPMNDLIESPEKDDLMARAKNLFNSMMLKINNTDIKNKLKFLINKIHRIGIDPTHDGSIEYISTLTEIAESLRTLENIQDLIDLKAVDDIKEEIKNFTAPFYWKPGHPITAPRKNLKKFSREEILAIKLDDSINVLFRLKSHLEEKPATAHKFAEVVEYLSVALGELKQISTQELISNPEIIAKKIDDVLETTTSGVRASNFYNSYLPLRYAYNALMYLKRFFCLNAERLEFESKLYDHLEHQKTLTFSINKDIQVDGCKEAPCCRF